MSQVRFSPSFIVRIDHATGVNLTADGDKGQLDAYVQNAEWDLEGRNHPLHGLLSIRNRFFIINFVQHLPW